VALEVDLRLGETSISDGHQLLRRAGKHMARQVLNIAIQKGTVVRPPSCQACGAPEPEGHHQDYGKPLEVEWLCRSCHDRLHRTNGVSPLKRAS